MKKWKQTAGFTLVELIVVIAILGILAGVGTVGYSGYIKKANMAADQQLVANVKNALELQSYSNLSGDNEGYVILTPKGSNRTPSASGAAEDAMEAMFGANWQSSALLAYSDWSDDGMLAQVAGQEGLEDVANSSIMKGSSVSELLGDVGGLTSAAGSIVNAQATAAEKYEDIGEYLPAGFLTLYQQAGLTVGTDVNNKPIFNASDDQLANLMVISVANELASLSNEQITKIANGEEDAPTVSTAASLAVNYALVKAYALSDEGGPYALEKYNAMHAAMTSATGIHEVMAALDSFGTVRDAEGNEAVDEEIAESLGSYINSASYTTDISALTAIMKTVNTISTDETNGYLNADDLSNKDLYTSGKVSNTLNNYVGASVISELGISSIEDGDVVVYFSNTVGTGAVPAAIMAG